MNFPFQLRSFSSSFISQKEGAISTAVVRSEFHERFFFVLIYGVSHGKEFCAVKGEIAHASIQNGEGIRDGHSLLCCKLLT